MSNVDKPLSPAAKNYIVKMFPCEKPCDSYGVCSNCIEAVIFRAGYNFGFRANENTCQMGCACSLHDYGQAETKADNEGKS